MSRHHAIAASSLGAPGERLSDVVAALRCHGAVAIELRAASDALVHTGMSAEQLAGVRDELSRQGLDVLSVASGVRLGDPRPTTDVVEDLLAHVRLAAGLGAPFVRVFPGIPVASGPFDVVPSTTADRRAGERSAARRLALAAPAATGAGVRLAVETHDSNPRGEDVRRILDGVGPGGDQALAVVWDLLHPWRVGETAAATWQALGPFLAAGHGYVQIKDVAGPRDLTPVLQGQGAIPLAECLHVLDRGGYAGPLSLEWERTWYPGVPPLSVALGAAVAAVRTTEVQSDELPE